MRSRSWATILISVAIAFSGCKKSPSERASPKAPTRFPIEVGGKFGYIDSAGQVVIKPQFDRAERFSEGRAAVVINDKYGYIDESGQMIVAPRFKFAGPFHAARAVVAVPETGVGYVDAEGRLVIEAKFYGGYAFSEGMAAVTPNNDAAKELGVAAHWNPVQFIDPTGKTIIAKELFVSKQPFHGEPGFHEGLAAASDRDGGTFGYVDNTGKFVIAPQFGSAFSFSEGLARVCVGKFCADDVGFIDKTGKVVIAPDLSNAEDFSDGLALITKDDKQNFIDKSGKVALEVPADHSASSFHEGRAVVSSPQNAAKQQCWYIDKAGKVVTAKYYMCEDFGGGLALVTLDDEETTAYVDKNDKVIWRSAKPL